MELKDLKLINNGGIPELEQRLEDKVASTAIPLEGSTGKSTLADRKAINNLPKFEVGKPGPVLITGLGGGTTNSFNFAGRTSAAAQLGKGLTPDASKAISGLGDVAGSAISSLESLQTGPSGGGGSGLGNAVGGAIDFVGGIASAGLFNMTADDALKDAGTSSGNIGGVGYTRLNDVDSAQISAQTSAENSANTVGLMGKGAALGASIGSVVGPVGGLIGGAVGAIGGLVGGLFGGAARKRKMRRMIAEAKDKAFRQNDYARSGALTSAMQQQYAQEFGDTESQSLYGFANGKQSFSAAGPTEEYNARVSNGEIIANKFTGEMFRVPGLPNNKDGKLALIRPTDTIITNKYGLSDYVAETGDLEGGEAMMSSIMKAKGAKGYKCGKLPKFDNGKWGVPEWSNFLGNMVPLIATGAEYFKNQAQPIGSYTATHSNPYASRGMQLMSQRQYNPYQAYNDMWNTYAKNSYGISNNGNLSSSQRALLRSTDYAGTLDRIAKLNEYAQDINNKYRADEAGYLLSEGRFGAEINQRDDMKHYDTYVASHGAKDLRGNTLLAQAGNLWLNMFKGFSDLDYYNYMKHMFDDDRRQEDEDRKTKNKIVVENPKKTATTKRKSMYPYKLPEVSKSIVYKNKPVVGADINPVIGNWNRFMNDSPQFVSPFITSLIK